MRIDAITTFPRMYDSVMQDSIMKRAQEFGLLEFHAHDLRDWTHDRHRTTDDDPYGGGQGLLMKCPPIFEAYDAVASEGAKPHVVFLAPTGVPFAQEVAQAQKVHLQQADGLAGRVIPAGDIGTVGRALPHGDVVHEANRGHNHRTGVHARLPDDAKVSKVYDLLSRGDTLGVFQLDSGGMQELLKRMKPTGFKDIVASLALYRPGPMGVNAHWDYADRKNGRKEITPIHPELEEPLKEILDETYGLIVSQEQTASAPASGDAMGE